MSEVSALAEQISGDMTINDVIRKYPRTMAVFNRYHLDSCCGGARTVKEEAGHTGVDLNEVLRALNEAAGGQGK